MHGANEAAGIFVLGILGFFTLVYAAAHVYAAYTSVKMEEENGKDKKWKRRQYLFLEF